MVSPYLDRPPASEPPLTAQIVFNTVRDHLLRQGVRAVMRNGYCAYRGDNGTKCALGCLIADSEYSPSMEGKNAAWVIDPDGEGGPLCQYTPFVDLLLALQHVHDSIEPEDWPDELAGVAAKFNLDPGSQS